MTTGSYSHDFTAPYTEHGGGQCGSSRIGLVQTKTWTGLDYSPALANNYTIVAPRFVLALNPEWTHWNNLNRRFELAKLRPPKWIFVLRKSRKVWYKLPKRARVEEHPYSVTWFASSSGPLTYTQRSPPNPDIFGYGAFPACFGWPIPNYSWNATNGDLALLGKLREKVLGSTFNPMVFIAEGPQALRMIAQTAITIAKALKQLQRGRFLDAAKTLVDASASPIRQGIVRSRPKSIEASPSAITERFMRDRWDRFQHAPPILTEKLRAKHLTRASKPSKIGDAESSLSSRWLELQYGWKPLLSDAADAAQYLAAQCSVPFQHVVRVKLRRVGDVFPNTASVNWRNKQASTVKRIKCILREKDVVTMPNLMDVASTVWEKLPYSFVVDWFIPIGNFLAARGLAQALSGTFVTTTVNKWFASEPYAFQPTVSISSVNCSAWVKGGNMTRVLSTTLSVPKPVMKTLGMAASWLHCVNAVALLSQVIRK